MELQTNAALILIDQQQGILHPRLGRRNNPQAEERIAELLAYWRQTARPLIHVQHLSHSEQSVFWPGQSGVEFQQRFMPRGAEAVIQKQVPDAFCATTLEADLRQAGIGQLVIVGVATHNSVESTARTAGNLGFDTWVVEDACYTFDKADFFGQAHSAEEVHAMSLGNLHGEYATVIDSRQILQRDL
ncbi:cysteine hydrolase family protein [Pseudomonas chlororaphis]|uniref:cysteine hydrolase family protein n=1 Tax=Pseudomonas chlororaphis TaxID=587753 RepID=UPI0006A5D693|nr:cysteine hydrolase family protein [Pseudomonas chlororaphis]AZC29295.1 Isochorismatase [Pseudomonas chlororaphis subsp. piscium]WDG82310.1 cysteine hydrolase family protein [Pseudomonas chlororaphis]WDG88706.1 cysteine hydrolase family protein [Pseudomonas chlororaphis]WDG94953.1 cysteine hydrolase family protein [Pseudomonas chlororaphis]SDT39801.1 Nicotinamidase-related amidase [Pseudomonas chlororaphis]